MVKYFTIKQANEILPDLIKKFEMLKRTKAEITKIGLFMESTTNDQSLESFIRSKNQLNHALAEFYRLMAEFEDTGIVLKSIEQGLADFPSKKFDKEIWLCWKEGEEEIKFWHHTDEGFNGRKPLEVNKESLI